MIFSIRGYPVRAFTALLVLLCLGAEVSAAEADKHRLRFVGFTRYRDACYVDMVKTKPAKGSVMAAWIWIKPAEKSILRSRLKQEFRAAGKSIASLSHMEQLKELDCRSERIRHVGTFYYDSQGRLLFERRYRQVSWQLIRPGSLWDNLRTVVCSMEKPPET
ncbi:MAG: hypothetical protein N2Z74_01335 [Syntrophales bacterium]|nr:hypothetical protein [Syntrophales bacterium]